MAAKKQKLVDLTKEEKGKVKKVTLMTLGGVAIICIILVGCFACTQDSGQPTVEMTPEQKIQYWTAQIMDANWAPQTDASNDGVLNGMFLARDATTTLDKDTGLTLIFFMADENTIFDTAQIILESDEGIIRLANDEEWHVKFSEKNEVMYMTIKDTKDKTVYYQQK